MIVKNEEDVIGRILGCVQDFANEIIVVDTGSTDETKSIALKYGAKVFDFDWCDDFSSARNFSFSKATSDYIMWLDADDFITKDNIDKINELKATLTDEDTIYMRYQIVFNEENKCTYEYLRERVVRNLKEFVWCGYVHEVLVPYGKCTTCDIAIEHRKEKATQQSRNLNIYLKMKNKGIQFNAREQFYFANELFYNGNYKEALANYKLFLKRKDAFVENILQAYLNMCKIYRILKNTQKAKIMIFNCFMYDLPRSEALCELGHIYYDEKDYEKAIYYYKLAIKEPNTNTLAFVSLDCYDYIPNLCLALCYYNLQDYKNAIKYNRRAIKANKQSPIAKSNHKYYLSAVHSRGRY